MTATTSRGSVGGSATVVVTPATLRIRTATFRSTPRGVDVTLAAVDGARRAVSQATLTLVARLEDRRVVRIRAATGAAGKASFRMPLGRGCFSLVVTHATAHGFLWDGRAPRLRVCR